MLAIEHRDGTGPFVYTRTPVPGLKDELLPNCKMYLQPGDVTYVPFRLYVLRYT